jgi:hypothetical protein
MPQSHFLIRYAPSRGVSRHGGAKQVAGQQSNTDPIYTQADWSGLGSGIGSVFSRLFGGGAPAQAPQAQPAQAGSQPVAIIPRALQQAPLPPVRPLPATAAPLPPARPAGLGAQPAAQQVGAQITLPQFDVNAAPMPSRPFTPTPSPNAAALSAAASIPVNLPPASSPGADSAALNAAASIPVNLPTASAPQAAEGPWTKYQTAQPSQPAPATPAAEGPWTRYQIAQPAPAVTANNDDKPWLDYQPAQLSKPASVVTRDPWEPDYFIPTPESPVLAVKSPELNPWEPGYVIPASATQQNGPRAWGQASNLDDPYANASLADNASAIGHTADNAVRNAVDGMTLGYGNKIAAGLDALTGRSPDYASALNAERAQSAQAMAQSPGGVGTAEQIAGMALPAGAIGRGAALIGDAAGALPFGLGRFAASPLVQASGTGAAVGGLNAAGNDQDVAPNAILGALAGAGGNALARSVAPLLAGPSVTAAAPSTQALKGIAQTAYNDAFQPGQIIAPESLQRLSDAIKTTMADNAYHPALHPGGAAVVDGINAFPAPGASATAGGLQNAGATLQGLDTLRRMAGQMGQNGQNPAAGRMGGLIRGNIDQFINGLAPADIVGASNPADSAAALARARQAYTTYSKANDLDEAVANAQSKSEGRDAQPGSIGKLTGQAIAKLRAGRSDWTPDELSALSEAANGTPTVRALAMLGRLAPTSPLMAGLQATGGGLGAFATGGGSIPASVAFGAGTLGARAAANRMTANAVNNLSNIVRSGGGAPFTLPPMGPRAASPLAALLMGSGVNALQPAQPYAPGLGAAFAQ